MRKLMATIALGVLLLGACGGGDDNKSDNASAGSDTTSEASGGNFSDFCGAKAGLSAGASVATPDPNALKNAAQNIDKAVSAAPSEIRADVRIVADAAKPFLELMASVNYDFSKLMTDQSKQQQLQALSAKFNDEKVKAASDRVNAWVAAHCS